MKNVISIVLNNFVNDNRVLKEAISLKNYGYNVKVVAVHDDNLEEREIVDGILVHRVRLKSRKWPKIQIVKLIKYLELTYRVAKEYRKADILHCNDLDALCIGYIMKRVLNKKIAIVYDAHEYETERNRMQKIHRFIAKSIESHCIKKADQVITVSDSIADEYVRLYGIDKPSLVMNCPEYTKVNQQDIFRKKFYISPNSVVFLYQGSLGPNRGVEVLLATFESLKDKDKKIVFMGYGPLAELIQKKAKAHDNIYYHQAVDRNILINYTASADFGIALIENSCLSHYYCLPNKFFEYAMAEIPLIVSNLPEMAKMIKKYEIGYVAESDTRTALCNVIESINYNELTKFKDNLIKFKNDFNWETQEKFLLEVYSRLEANND